MLKNIFFTGVLCSISIIAGINQAGAADQTKDAEVTELCCDSQISLKQYAVNGTDFSKRLEKFKLWLCSLNKPCLDIQDALSQRYNLFIDTGRSYLETEGYMTYRSGEEKIRIIIFISLSCPLCKRLYNELIDSLSIVPLGKSVSITAVPFTNNETDRLYSALFKQGKQIAILRALYPLKERVTTDVVVRLADSLGVDTVELLKDVRSSQIINRTARSREIGIAAGVKVTPTFFINNIRYSSYKDIRWIIDYIELIAQRSVRKF